MICCTARYNKHYWAVYFEYKRDERCCTFHCLSLTNSIKPNLQFAFLYFGLVKGSTFTGFSFYDYISLQQYNEHTTQYRYLPELA